MSVADKRAQVYFPMGLYRKIEKRAKKESRSMASVVRDAVEGYLKEGNETDWSNDPFFKIVGIAESGKKDAAERHDKYLYGRPGKK